VNHSEREDLLQLLPWYENGTLRATERDAVRALLATDFEANRQRRELRALHREIADEPMLADNVATNWRRLQTRIGTQGPRRAWWFAPTWIAAATALLVSVSLTMFLAGERVGRYHTLTTPTTQSTPAGSVLYRVDVAAGIDATELIRLTGAPRSRVLQGPSERGVALLAVPVADAATVERRLREDPRLRFVAALPR
jgi:hypothetical protein